MSAEMTAQLVTDALVMAIWRRGKPDALLHHSDRGSQGGFNRSPQHRPSQPIRASGQATLRAYSNQASCGAGS
jgi:transposase InsO family protein